jgi:hypothetical protein
MTLIKRFTHLSTCVGTVKAQVQHNWRNSTGSRIFCHLPRPVFRTLAHPVEIDFLKGQRA